MNYGVITLLPPVLAIVMAIITRRTIECLLLGIVSSYVIISGTGFLTATIEAILATITDYDNAWLILVCGLFGSLIALLNAAKATNAFSSLVGKFCKTGKRSLFVSWILGIIIFIDDYMNIMTISACMRKVCDERKVPRESLAYVIDSTGAPTCVLLPFSTWAVFFAGVFFEYDVVKSLGYDSGISTYIQIIPYIFYAIFALLIVPLFILGIIPKIGAMRKAYERTEKSGMVFSENSRKLNKLESVVDNGKKGSILDFVIPIVAMIVITTINNDMLLALVVAIILCVLMYIPRKIISFGEFCEIWIQGFADTIPALAIIVMALAMRKAVNDLGLPEYVINLLKPYMSTKTFPLFTFVIVSILGFVTGSNWGTPAVCAAIILPLAGSIQANMLLTMGAIVSGGTFCSHACFYSDATVITSSSCGIENVDHVKTQMPYAMICFAISCVAYFITGALLS